MGASHAIRNEIAKIESLCIGSAHLFAAVLDLETPLGVEEHAQWPSGIALSRKSKPTVTKSRSKLAPKGTVPDVNWWLLW